MSLAARDTFSDDPQSSYALDYNTAPAVISTELRRMPALDDGESGRAKAVAMLLAIALTVAYFLFLFQYWAPAHSGTDQNGYLVGGKQLAHTGSTGLMPENGLGFVGAMWVRVSETGMNYPKYPNGLPLLYASFLWVFGESGLKWAFLVSPVGSAMAMLGTYCLARQFAGTFASLCAMMLIGCSQAVLVLANNPNSHGSCLAFVIWGVFLLMRFWETASAWKGLLAGFLLGYAVTIRYTEGLLALLIGMVVLSMVRWRDWRGYWRVAMPVLGWLIPVGYLVIFNLVAMGTPTGYDTTNESKPGSAFTLEHVAMNWEKLIRQVHDSGLFFAVPIGLLGMLLAWRSQWRRAAILWLWLLPGTAIYMSYYWAPDRGVSYLRFFVTLLPPLAVGAAVAFEELINRFSSDSLSTWGARFRTAVAPVACGCIVAMSSGLGLYRALSGLEDGQETATGLEGQHLTQANLAELGAVAKHAMPAESVIFAPTPQLHYLQFIGNYDCFAPEYFTTAFVQRLQRMEESTDAENDPMTQQTARRRWLLSIIEGKSEQQLTDLQTKVIEDALTANRRVFFVVTRAGMETSLRRFTRRNSVYQTKTVARYYDMPRIPTVSAENEPADPVRRSMGFGRRGAGGQGARNAQPQQWLVVELVRKSADK